MKRIFGIIFVLIVLTAFTPPGCFADDLTCSYSESLTLSGNKTLGDNCEPLRIKIIREVTLDLNGYDLGGSLLPYIECDGSCSLTITDTSNKKTGTLNAETIDISGSLEISGGTVNVTVDPDDNTWHAINAQGDITISGGTVNATGGVEGAGIYADTGSSITISGGQVTVTGGTYGIHARGGITIESGGMVEATGGTYGIHARGDITIESGGTVTAAGGDRAIDGTVKNTIPGFGWTNKEGTEGPNGIPVSVSGQSLTSYKKVQFPAKTADVTFEVVNGAWDDGNTGDIPVTLYCVQGGNLKLAADQIPSVGTKPKPDYQAGKWDQTPTTETVFTENTTKTFTYTYASVPVSYTVTFKVVNGFWDDDPASGDRYVTLGGYKHETLTLGVEKIPPVGSKPAENCGPGGSWDIEPDTVTRITGDMVFTYTYTEKPSAAVTTAPAARDLTYSGQAQELVTAGTASGGTMQYALGTDAETAPSNGWDTKIPAGTDAVTYYVWYKAAGDTDHNDSVPKWVQVRIKDESELPFPVFDPNPGSYDSAQTVTISCAEEGATIYYTTDDSEPTVSSTRYSGPIEVSESLTIKAFAVKENMKNSIVTTGAYTITKETMELPAEVSVVQGNGEKGVPDDVKARTIRLTIRLKQNGEVKLSSAPIELAVTPGGNTKPAEISGVVFTPNVPDFKKTCGNYEYEVLVTPGEVKADIAGAGDDGPAYILRAAAGSPDCEKFVVTLYWNSKAAAPAPEVIRVVALPEDEIGAYALRADGTKEYLIFQTYDICMAYLGRDELCAGPERCYHK